VDSLLCTLLEDSKGRIETAQSVTGSGFRVWYEAGMRIFRSLVALLSCGFAAHAQELQPLIDRPVTLPQGKVDLTLQGQET
jgi:hypothetical protein